MARSARERRGGRGDPLRHGGEGRPSADQRDYRRKNQQPDVDMPEDPKAPENIAKGAQYQHGLKKGKSYVEDIGQNHAGLVLVASRC